MADSINETVRKICKELEKANEKFPKFNSTHEGFAVIKEELDEAWDEIKANNEKAAKREMIQVAAMAIKFLTTEFCKLEP